MDESLLQKLAAYFQNVRVLPKSWTDTDVLPRSGGLSGPTEIWSADELARKRQRDFAAGPGREGAIYGGSPEAGDVASAILGLAASGGGVPGSVSRATGTPEVPLPKANRNSLIGNEPEWMSRAASERKPLNPEDIPEQPLNISPELLEALTEAAAKPTIPLGGRRVRRSVAAENPGLEINASAESGSGGSLEALHRMKVMQEKGETFVRGRGMPSPGNTGAPTTEDGGINLRPGEWFGIKDAQGNIQILNRG